MTGRKPQMPSEERKGQLGMFVTLPMGLSQRRG
jgi:hypothetical protein